MLKTLAVSTLLVGSMAAFAQPAAARDRDDHRNDRDRDRYARNYDHRGDRDHEREEWREHERFENRFVPYAYRAGYGDPRFGYYDRFGVWCWY